MNKLEKIMSGAVLYIAAPALTASEPTDVELKTIELCIDNAESIDAAIHTWIASTPRVFRGEGGAL